MSGRGIACSAIIAAMFLVSCRSVAPDLPGEGHFMDMQGWQEEGGSATAGDGAVSVPPPPFTEGIFPCSDCHAGMKPDLTVRVLEDEHTNIKLDHGERRRWCFDCHSPEDRDKLRLASGELIEFTESYKLCGQCHGIKLRDWRAGVHGKRTGEWNGKKQYLLCAHCHYPHSPHFKPLEPEPPPSRPES